MIDIDWIEVPQGKCLMGLSTEQAEHVRTQMRWLKPDSLNLVLDPETPQRTINVHTFYIARYPITVSQYLEFVREGHPGLDDPLLHYEEYGAHPVNCLWHHAIAFCNWIGARLPSSIEWEKAARGIDGRFYPWGNDWDPEKGNFGQRDRRERTGGTKTSPVDAYPEGASPYGVENLVGNCYEWTMSLESIWGKQSIIIRGTPPDPEAFYPVNHRVTSIIMGWLFGDTFPPYTTFRPIMDEWQRQYR